MRNWTPPNASKLPLDQRTAHMEVTVNREGRLVRFKLAKSSGSKDLDESVKEAGNRLDKIGAELPATYLHDLYEFQVNFHVE
jgi:TonB family protein